MVTFFFTVLISGFGSLVLLAAIASRVSQQCRQAVERVAVLNEAEAIRGSRQHQLGGLSPHGGLRVHAGSSSGGESR